MSTDADAVLDRVRRYRLAARRAVRADVSFRDRCLALLDIADMARDESDPTVKVWSERVVWEESKAFLGMDDDEPDLPPPTYEQRARQLRRDGLVACDRCFHPLPTDDELELWEQRRRRYIELLKVREGAAER